MRMLKIIRAAQPSRLFFAVFITFALTSLAGEAASLKKIKARGYLNIATEDNYAPFEIMKGSKASGFTNDVVAELKKYADFKIRQDILPWSGLLASVRAGKYDCAITGSIISEERLRVFDFTMPTASAQHYYITRKGDDRIKGVKDLNGLTVGVQAGSVLLSRLPELDAMLKKTGGKLGKVVEYTSYPEVYEDLANGRLDYAINAIVSAQNLISKRGDTFALGEPVSGFGFHAYPVPKGNEDLLVYLNGFITHLYKSGKLAELQKKWFGRAFPDLPRQSIKSVKEFKKLTKAQ